MNIFHQRFPASQVVNVTGVTPNTLQSWMRRGHIVGQRETGMEVDGGGQPGVHRLFSFFNIMEIAVAKALLDAGLGDLDDAFDAARRFAHVGHGFHSKDHPERSPSCPFNHHGQTALTLLFVRGETSKAVFYQLGRDPLLSLLREHGGGVILEIDPVFRRVVSFLGHHPEEVLDLVYPARTTDQAAASE